MHKYKSSFKGIVNIFVKRIGDAAPFQLAYSLTEIIVPQFVTEKITSVSEIERK